MNEINQHINDTKKQFSFWRFIKRLFITSILASIIILLVTVLLVFVYENEVKNSMIKELNKHLNCEVRIDPKNIDLTLIKSFPDCALEFKQIVVMDAVSLKTKDTLLVANRLALAFNIKDLYYKKYHINAIELEDARAFLKIDKKGKANYMVWKTDINSVTSNDSVSFALEHILIKNTYVNYKNIQRKIKGDGIIKELHFKGVFNNDDYLLTCKGKTFINLFQVDKIKYVDTKNLKFDTELDVTSNLYTIKHSETVINKTQLVSNGSFRIKDSLTLLDVNFNGKNLDIASVLSLLPEKFQAQISDYKSDGEFYAKGSVYYSNTKPFTINADFGIKQATITYKPQNTTLSNVNLSGSINLNKDKSVLKLNNINANLNSNSVSASIEVIDFKNPYLKLNGTLTTKLQELITFYPIDTLQDVSGDMNAKVTIEGLVSDIKSGTYNPNIKAEGTLKLNNLKAKFKQSDKEISVTQGDLYLDNNQLTVTELKTVHGTSDLVLNGEVPNFLQYVFDTKAPLTVNAKLVSDKISVEDFLFTSNNSSSTSSISIPSNIELNIETHINHLSFGKFSATDMSGIVLLKQQKLALKDVVLSTCDGEIKLNTFIDASSSNIDVSGCCHLNKLNIKQLFLQLNDFGQNTIQNQHLKGFITSYIDFGARWNKALVIDLNSVNAKCDVLIERGELLNFKPLESLAKYIDINELKRIKFSTLQSMLDIKNKTISIPKTSIKSNAINLELSGTHTFDNQIDYHIQLLLSELLAKKSRANKQFDEELSLIENDPENRRSVFISMIGSIDNPTITYDKKGAKEKIKNDIKQEKQNLKQLFKEEFGLFKKDSITKKNIEKAQQSFQLEQNQKLKEKPLTPKKKDDEDDF